MTFSFVCTACGETHTGMPGFAAEAPFEFHVVPAPERSARCQLTTDTCIIDGEDYFVRGCIEIPVRGHHDPFVWGVWVSLSEASFGKWQEIYSQPKRAHVGPFFGWLNASLKPYPETLGLKTRVHLRDDGIRPFIELEPTDHPLAVEQRTGITPQRVQDLFVQMVHADA